MASAEVTLCGNLATDPEIKPTKNSVLTRFRIAVNDRRKQGDDWVDDPSLSKGDRVMVKGRLKENTWTDNEGNEKRTVEVVAEDVAASLMFATIDKIDRVSSVAASKPSMPKPEYTNEEPF